MSIFNTIKEIVRATFLISIGVKGTVTDYDKEVEEKEGIKFKEKKEVKKGWWEKFKSGVGKIIDFIAAPSTLKLITLACIGFLALSPFGAVAIGICAGVSVGCLVSSTIIDGKSLRDLKVQQKEALALEKLMGLKKEKLQILAENPKLAEVLKNDLDKKSQMQGQDKTVRIKNVLQSLPECIVPLIGNVMTGNPISIGIGIFTLLTDITARVGEQQSFSKQRDKMMEIVKSNQELLGVEFPTGKGLEFLKDKIRESDAELKALERLAKNNVDKTAEDIKKDFQQYKKEEMDRNKNQEFEELKVKGLAYYTGSAFVKSFSYDKSREVFAPLAEYDEAKQVELKNDIRSAEAKIIENTKQIALNQKQEEKAIAKEQEKSSTHDKNPPSSHVDKYYKGKDAPFITRFI